jgi:HAMP domain-containing protein
LADKIDASIVDEVEKRLDDLFGDSDDASDFEGDGGDIEGPLELEEGGDVEDTPLKELKSIVLSIDWEITDEIMTNFLDQVDGLKEAYKDDKVVLMFLQLLGSVGKYIKAKKESAHPDVVKLLNTAYAGLEKVLLTEDITETERKKLLIAEVNEFKKLRERLTGKASAERKVATSPQAEKKAEPEVGVSAAASGVGEKERAVVESAAISKTKGLGVGTKIALIVLFPLIIVAAFGYIYVSQLTGVTSQIDQLLQTYSGVPVAEAKNTVLAILGGLVILIGLIAANYGSRLALKIKQLTNVVNRISAGETEAAIKIKTRGEIGALAEAIGRMRESLR